MRRFQKWVFGGFLEMDNPYISGFLTHFQPFVMIQIMNQVLILDPKDHIWVWDEKMDDL